jgi:uncharacterized membrane protein
MQTSPFLQAHGLLRYVGLFLSGVCHQLPEHSILVMGVQMPLCARCMGTYLAVPLGLCNFWLRGRSRASRLPPAKVLAVLGLFFALWAMDSVNSYFHFLTGRVGLYTPSNFLRLMAGMVNGLSLSLLVFPMFNFILWREPDKRRVINGLGELVGILLQLVALGVLLQANVSVLIYPLFVLNLVSVLLMLTIVNSMIVMILLRRENDAERWSQVVLPLSLGLLLSIAEVGSIAVLRYSLAPQLPLPVL